MCSKRKKVKSSLRVYFKDSLIKTIGIQKNNNNNKTIIKSMVLIIMSRPDGNCAAVQEKIISNSNRLSFIFFSFGLKSHSVPLN